MTDEARIQRLTELARRVWPDLGVQTWGDERHVAVSTRTRDNIYNHPVRIVHPRALDALEAALLVLAGEAPAWVEHLASGWTRCAESDCLFTAGERGMLRQCARELRERARGEP